MEDYYFFKELFLRCPVYEHGDYSPGRLGEVLRDRVFQVGLGLASPGLYEVVAGKGFELERLSERERWSLLRYYNRMCFRATPFGSFASFSLAGWGDDGPVVLGELGLADLHLQLDWKKCLALGDMGGYRVNPGLYRVGKEYRFIRTNRQGEVFSFDLESLERNALVAGCRAGKDLVSVIRKVTGCSETAAVDYLNFLVEAGVLLELGSPNVIGDDRGRLGSVKLSSAAPGEFYAGLERKVEGGLANGYQEVLRDGLTALAKLVPASQPVLLGQFIKDFKSKYDRRKVRLLEALDPDIGVGYGPSSSAAETGLLNKVNFKLAALAEDKLTWTAVHRLLLRLWRDNPDSYAPLALSEADLQSLPAQRLALPPTLPVLFRVVEEGVLIESAGGATATALIGRFTPWSREVYDLGKELAAREEAANAEVVFADISLLSAGHADNINRREAVYTYELPVNTVSLLPEERQIALDDLWVSVRGEELVLESGRLGKVVIPRLSSAYNYGRVPLAVFRLLCDLQYQGLQANFSLNLAEFFPGLPFYPRIVYKKSILALATWYLTGEELRAMNSVAAVRQRGWPTVIALSRSDQQLVFRLDEEDEVIFLLDCLKGLEQAVIREYLLPVTAVAEQYVAFLAHDQEVYKTLPVEIAVKAKVTPDFMLGSRWLYLKLYINPALADRILVKKLLPLLRRWDRKLVRSWFFIRYRDPGYHIRLRLLVREKDIGAVLGALKKRLAVAATDQLIREYQADTYRRELERYGPDVIALVEGVFYGSSELVINYMKVAAGPGLGFVSVSGLLDLFIPDTEAQLVFLSRMVGMFYTEFVGDKSLKVELDQKYRELQREIDHLLADKNYFNQLRITVAAKLFDRKVNKLLKVATGFSRERREQLLADIIHMHLNRLFADRQREQELVVYYCLHKQRLAARAKAAARS